MVWNIWVIELFKLVSCLLAVFLEIQKVEVAKTDLQRLKIWHVLFGQWVCLAEEHNLRADQTKQKCDLAPALLIY